MAQNPSRQWSALTVLGLALALLVLSLSESAPAPADTAPQRLTSQARPTPAAPPALEVGKEVKTGAGERQRFALADGSLVFVNERTSVKLDAARRLGLQAGEVFIEVADASIVVTTPQRTVTARAAQFGVRALGDGTGVLAARGELTVSDVAAPLRAGTQLLPGSAKPTDAGRVSHLLGWTRELMNETPLVPASPHAGGSIVAVDPQGQPAKLSLRRYHVDVHVEDGFARTTIDQTYFNHEAHRLEGTFHFPLPADASLSRLAMYVDGKLMEGGMAERDYARTVYESIVYRQKDPALLEWVDGTTFKMRVFPLEARQEKRIVLSYTQKLPALYGQQQYRLPAGHSLGAVRDWSAQVRVKDGAGLNWACASHALAADKDGTDLVLTAKEKDAKLDRDLVLHLTEAQVAAAAARFSAAELDGAQYLMLRYRPALPGQAERQRRDWIFLCETSADRDPLLVRTQIEVIRGLLSRAEPEDAFVVVAANTRLRTMGENGWATAGPPLRPVTPENVQTALQFLENSHVIGALDLGRALTEVEPFCKAGKNPYLVHLGTGIAAMGERRDDVLAGKAPAGAHYVGIGVGRRWSRSFMKAGAERTGGYFTQVNPDEPISWRAFDLAATLATPRLLNVRVTDKAGAVKFLTLTGSAAQGEEICAVASFEGPPPEAVVVSGKLGNAPWEQTIALEHVRPGASHLPRTWAKLEMDRLLADSSRDPMATRQRVIELSKQMYVMTPYTSLLVLENEAMYEEYKVDRGRKDHWALYPCPAKVPVVYEPLPGMPPSVTAQAVKPKPTPAQVLDTLQVRGGRERPPATVGQIVIVGNDVRVSERNLGDLRFDGGKEYPRKRNEGYLVPPSANLMPILERPFGPLINKTPAFMSEVDYDSYRSLMPLELATSRNPFDTAPLHNARDMGGAPRRLRELLNNSEHLQVIDAEVLRNLPGPSALRGYDGVGRYLQHRPEYIPPGSAAERLFFEKEGQFERPEGQYYYQNNGLFPISGKKPEWTGFVTNVQVLITQDTSREASLGERLVYRRPSYTSDDRIFFDLVACAPSMSTMRADVQAQIEAETLPDPHAAPGKIDPDARRLIEQARQVGWQSYQADGLTIQFDGAGRYRWERTLFAGLREQVVCDGRTLWHLYPDLGIGARRTVSRFHQSALTQFVPWVLPKPEDLARGVDLLSVDARTVAMVPTGVDGLKDEKGKPVVYVRLHLVFEDGRLVERQLVEMPAKKIVARQTLAADGVIRQLDGAGKELAVSKGKLSPTPAPSLQPEVAQLVVLPLPYRTPEYVQGLLAEKKIKLEERPVEEALPLFAAHFAKGNAAEALRVFKNHFHQRNQRQIGFYVLLAACGQNLDGENADVLAEHANEPLAQYLALYSSPVLRKHASQWAVGVGQWADGFLKHLAVSHALLQRWQSNRPVGAPEQERAAEYIRKHPGTAFAWALLTLMQDRTTHDAEAKQDVRARFAALAELFGLFEKTPGLAYAARYEQARCLWEAGQPAAARARFRALHAETVKDGSLPIIDAHFRTALLQAPQGEAWDDLVRATAKRFVADKRRQPVLLLAWQCQQVNDTPLANHLIQTALTNLPDEKERLGLTLAAIDFLMKTGQLPQADALLAGLLADPEQAERPELWRLGAELAVKREMTARTLHCLEKALAAEYRRLPDVIDVKAVRADYQRLLQHYQNLADAMTALKVAPPPDFLERVVSAADRWRALDSDTADVCQQTARILQTLGRQELAWDYLTTPVGMKPSDAEPWSSLGWTLQRKGDLELADRAFAAAFATEPTNAQYLWDRAQNLRQAGKGSEATALLKQLADGSWQPRFAALKSQARWQVGGK